MFWSASGLEVRITGHEQHMEEEEEQTEEKEEEQTEEEEKLKNEEQEKEVRRGEEGGE